MAIVGLGGLGSHVVQQLCYLGVGRLTLIDPDIVEVSNLNRLVGATAEDAQLGTPKVRVAERLVRAVDADIEVVASDSSIARRSALELLHAVDYVVGCVDNDGPRFLLATFCAVADKPYLDLATDIMVSDNWFGGRIFFSTGEGGCLLCADELDQREIRLWTSSEAELREDERIYGSGVIGQDPSVVSLNGVMASAGVMELMVAITGIRSPNRRLEYHPTGKLAIDVGPVTADCYYCQSLRGSQDFEPVERLLSRLPAGR